MKLDDNIFTMWIEWVKKIEADLIDILNKKQIYNSFIDLVNANLDHIKENDGIIFCDFVRSCYATQAAVSIRRHIKTKDDDICLMKLLDQIKKCASQFTYDFYLKRYPIDGFEWQKSTFSNFSQGGQFVSEDIIAADMQT